jgi:hypothetical protein
MDPLTIVVFVLFVVVVILLAWLALQPVSRSSLEGIVAGAGDTARRRVWATSAVWIVSVPLLMVALSVVLPSLRNPLVLVVGGLVGFLLPRHRTEMTRSWTGMAPWGRAAFVGGIALLLVLAVLLALLLSPQHTAAPIG